MSGELITWLATYIYTLLIAAILQYGLLLNLLGKRGAAKPALLWKVLFSAAASLFAWVIATRILNDYYLGKSGFVTSQDTTMLVPIFVLVQNLLLPLLVAIGIIVLLFVSYRGQYATSNWKLKSILVTLLSFGTLAATALLFLGVLIP